MQYLIYISLFCLTSCGLEVEKKEYKYLFETEEELFIVDSYKDVESLISLYKNDSEKIAITYTPNSIYIDQEYYSIMCDGEDCFKHGDLLRSTTKVSKVEFNINQLDTYYNLKVGPWSGCKSEIFKDFVKVDPEHYNGMANTQSEMFKIGMDHMSLNNQCLNLFKSLKQVPFDSNNIDNLKKVFGI